MSYADLHNLRDVLPGIRSRADALDLSGEWPATDLEILATVGAHRWAVPMVHGGEDLSALEIHFRYEAIARASLATALVLSQRDSAVGMIDGAEDWPLRADLLAQLAANELFATIGIAQLTTSHQGGPPALRAVPAPGGAGYQLNGFIPWSTGADHAAYLLAGAALPDGNQILFALPTHLPGVLIGPPLPLVALGASHTARIDLQEVHLDPQFILRGPVPHALASRKKGLPLAQAFLALGLCAGALDLIADHPAERARSVHDRFAEQLQALRSDVLTACAPAQDPATVAAQGPALRGRCNDLALRLTHAAVTLYKGAALIQPHPAQRLAREALFLLVWSCPAPVIDCTLDLLTEEAG
jgi:alkylation response protein AidB-like acyl-CoA dehydrogenase